MLTHKMRSQDTTDLKKIPVPVHAAIATILFCVATVGYAEHVQFGQFFAGVNDFLPRYTQARMAGSQQMFSIKAGYREQERTFRFRIAGASHARFPWPALLMAPLGRLPYLWAYWIWVGLSLTAFAGLVWTWLLPRDCVLRSGVILR